MTSDEIRVKAIDVLARVLFEADEPGADQAFEDWAPRYRQQAAPYIDALSEAGLLPTSMELEPSRRPNCDLSHFVRRYVTDWQKAPTCNAIFEVVAPGVTSICGRPAGHDGPHNMRALDHEKLRLVTD